MKLRRIFISKIVWGGCEWKKKLDSIKKMTTVFLNLLFWFLVTADKERQIWIEEKISGAIWPVLETIGNEGHKTKR